MAFDPLRLFAGASGVCLLTGLACVVAIGDLKLTDWRDFFVTKGSCSSSSVSDSEPDSASELDDLALWSLNFLLGDCFDLVPVFVALDVVGLGTVGDGNTNC